MFPVRTSSAPSHFLLYRIFLHKMHRQGKVFPHGVGQAALFCQDPGALAVVKGIVTDTNNRPGDHHRAELLAEAEGIPPDIPGSLGDRQLFQFQASGKSVATHTAKAVGQNDPFQIGTSVKEELLYPLHALGKCDLS